MPQRAMKVPKEQRLPSGGRWEMENKEVNRNRQGHVGDGERH